MTKCDHCNGEWNSERGLDITIGEFTRNIASGRLKSIDEIWIRLGYSGKHICFNCFFQAESIEKKVKMRKEFTIMLDRCGCSRASLSFTAREAIHTTLETGVKIEKTVPSCTPSRCFPTLYHFLYPNGGFTGVSDMCKRSLKKHLEKEKTEKETSEWELGIHGSRFDEKRGKCPQCGDQEFIKNGKCRHCRGVCSDCGREDVPKDKLEAYGSGGPYLCADCTCSRMY